MRDRWEFGCGIRTDDLPEERCPRGPANIDFDHVLMTGSELRTFRSVPLVLLLVFAGGLTGRQGRLPRRRPVADAGGSAPVCANGTVASYLGTRCSQLSTVYHWLSYSCTSTPASICGALGTNGANVQILMDPKGPDTLLVTAKGSSWNVKAGQSVDVAIGSTVYGATANGNWPHFNHLNGQSGDGTGEYITTVACGANCRDIHQGASDILCSASSPAVNCADQDTVVPYLPEQAAFANTTSASPYPLTIEIKLNGGKTGTATLSSVGTHVGIPPK
jgi:hypothetical protein